MEVKGSLSRPAIVPSKHRTCLDSSNRHGDCPPPPPQIPLSLVRARVCMPLLLCRAVAPLQLSIAVPLFSMTTPILVIAGQVFLCMLAIAFRCLHDVFFVLLSSMKACTLGGVFLKRQYCTRHVIPSKQIRQAVQHAQRLHAGRQANAMLPHAYTYCCVKPL